MEFILFMLTITIFLYKDYLSLPNKPELLKSKSDIDFKSLGFVDEGVPNTSGSPKTVKDLFNGRRDIL